MKSSAGELRFGEFIRSLGGRMRKKGVVKLLIVIGAVVLILLLINRQMQGKEKKSAEKSETAYLEELCSSIKGVGECRVAITYVTEAGSFGSPSVNRVDGVVVLCEGGSKVSVRAELTEIICALYDIGANRVEIAELNFGK